MQTKVVKTSDEAARLADTRIRISREAFALAPWDRDHTDAPLVYWSPDYEHDKKATDAPRIENEDGEPGEVVPGVLFAQVYAYEHGGVTVATRPQVCGGVPCGCVWCDVAKFREYYGDGAKFAEVAADFVAEVDAYYNGDIYAVSVEEWNAAARDWDYIDGCGNFYPGKTDADTLAALVSPGFCPGRVAVVCADDDAGQFVGLECDDGRAAAA